MQTKKIYFVANVRMPTEKAHGIHIAKMCEAFIEAGEDVILLVPRGAGSIKDFYGLRVEVPTVRLPALQFRRYGRLGFAFMGASFMLAYVAYLWLRRLRGERFMLYTVDIDTFSHTALPLCGSVIAEFHSPKEPLWLSRFFFKRARVVATNILIGNELHKTFGVKPLIEPNGVDQTWFDLPDKSVVRSQLGLPSDGRLVLYVGRFYKWKGLQVLASASMKLAKEGIQTLVLGGTQENFAREFGGTGVLQFNEAPPADVPIWLAAADVLLVIGTTRNDESNLYTAPMKIFEYLASGRPVVASATEALRSLIPEHVAKFARPDDPEALAQAVRNVLVSPPEVTEGIQLAREHTWARRAQRILQWTHL